VMRIVEQRVKCPKCMTDAKRMTIFGKDMKMETSVVMVNVVARETRLGRAVVLLGVGYSSGNLSPWAVRKPLY
jgi:hypothetical protein